MTQDKIILENIEFYGYHGVYEAERQVGHRYSVDVEIGLDLSRASESDHVADTIDYSVILKIVLEEGQEHRYRLLESLAGAIARRILAVELAEWVRVKVRKDYPPVPGVMANVAVEIVRGIDLTPPGPPFPKTEGGK